VDGTARDVIPVPVVPDKMAVPAPTVNDEIRVPDAPEGLPPGSAGEHKIPEPERKAVTPPPAAGY
jgi:hypothetical protein